MLPAHAPLPTASSFPFHAPSPEAEAGNHTSILMSESPDGVSVAATRQNAGRFVKASAPRPPRPFGGVNCFAPTDCASVTATCACENVDRLSQVAPIAGVAKRTNAIASFMTVSVGRPFQGRRAALKGPPYFRAAATGPERPVLLQLLDLLLILR